MPILLSERKLAISMNNLSTLMKTGLMPLPPYEPGEDVTRYTPMPKEDIAAWAAWCDRPEPVDFLERTIIKCRKLAEENRNAQGFAEFPAA